MRELSHLEQLGTWSDPDRHPDERQLATAYLGLVPTDVDPAVPGDTAGTPSTSCRAWRSTTARSCSPAASACARSSRTRTSASRSRRRRSRSRSCATSTRRRSATRSRRRTSSASSSAASCSRRPASAGRRAAGGRPASVFRFVARARGHGSVRGAPAAEHAVRLIRQSIDRLAIGRLWMTDRRARARLRKRRPGAHPAGGVRRAVAARPASACNVSSMRWSTAIGLLAVAVVASRQEPREREASLAVAVRADRAARRAVALLRPHAARGHRPLRQPRRRAAAHRPPRARRRDRRSRATATR